MILALVYLCLLYNIVNGQECSLIDPRGYCADTSLVFNRVDMTNDIHRHISIKLYAFSRESIVMNTMIIFHSPHRQLANNNHSNYHNALVIGGSTYRQYYKITKDSKFEYNNEIPLITRANHFMIPYTVMSNPLQWDKIIKQSSIVTSTGVLLDGVGGYDYSLVAGSTLPVYHAVMSMDKSSSIWDLYNIMSLDRYHMTLRYDAQGLTSNIVGEYSGLIKLPCIQDVYYTCLLNTDNNNGYNLIVDLHSSMNYLPIDLYYAYQALPSSRRSLTFELTDSPGTPLVLNSKFTYLLNEHNNDIIIGVDLLHHFPKIEYSAESGAITLWYFTATYVNNEQSDAVAITFAFFILFILFSYWEYICSDNKRVYTFILYHGNVTSKWFYFTFRQVFAEIVAVFFSFLIILLTSIFSDYNTTLRCQRMILLLILSVYHTLVLTLVIIVTPHVTRKAIKYYLRIDTVIKYNTNKNVKNKRDTRVNFMSDVVTTATTTTTVVTDTDFEQVKTSYVDGTTEKLSKELTINTLARNMSLMMLVMVDIMLILNFSSEASYLYLLLLFFASLVFIYFMAYYIALNTLYLLVFPSTTRPVSFLWFYVGEILCAVLFIGWGIHCLYLDYFQSINSIYSDTFINAFTPIMIGIIIILACRGFYSRAEHFIRKTYKS